MILRNVYLREILKIWAQWGGASLAAIPGGIILGMLLRSGMGEQKALGIAMGTAGILAVALWELFGRLVARRTVEFSAPTIWSWPAHVINVQFTGPVTAASPAFAGVILCVFLQNIPPQATYPIHTLSHQNTTTIPYAIPTA